MRREGYELAVGKPIVIEKEIDGVMHEPVEELVVDCPDEVMGSVMELVGERKGEMIHMETAGTISTCVFEITSRGLIGLRTRVLTATQGEAIMHHTFERYQPASATSNAASGRAHRHRDRPGHRLRRRQPRTTAASCSSSRATRSTRARSSASTTAPTT
jgi:predicted membrane GTPase involved in stress response